MKSPIRLAVVVVVAISCVASSARLGRAQVTILADFENVGTGTGGPGTDFDAFPTDQSPVGPGCWYEGAGQQTLTNLTQSTIGVTHGTKSMKTEFIGRGAGGGDGLSDTHFATPVRVTWIPTDPAFIAIRDAASGGNSASYTIEFDVTYDIPALRALSWLGPPVDFPAKPAKFIGVGIYKAATGDGGPYTHAALEQALPTLIDPFSPAFDGVTYLTRHSVVPFNDFQFTANPVTVTQYELGFSYNGNWGTNPAASNTQAATVYIDNILLRLSDPRDKCDMDRNGGCNFADYQLFMGDHLKTTPTYGDLVGNLGVQGHNGVNDFYDYIVFQEGYEQVNGGGSLARAISGVPEPGSLVLVAFGIVAMTGSGTRRCGRNRLAQSRSKFASVLERRTAMGCFRQPFVRDS